MPELLFVYGTLRPPTKTSNPVRSFNYLKIVPFLFRQWPARLQGADLYDLGSFPAAVPGKGELTGVLLELDPAAFQVLDPLERHPDLYRRERVEVLTDDGPAWAWIYWAPEELAQMGVLVENGDWLGSETGERTNRSNR